MSNQDHTKDASTLQDMELVSKEGAAITRGLMLSWEKLGKPDDCSTPAGWKLLDVCVNLWTKVFRNEAEAWIHDRKLDLEHEKSLKDLTKDEKFGYNPVSYPPTLYSLLKTMLPKQNLKEKKFISKLSKRHPMFKTTNLSI